MEALEELESMEEVGDLMEEVEEEHRPIREGEEVEVVPFWLRARLQPKL